MATDKYDLSASCCNDHLQFNRISRRSRTSSGFEWLRAYPLISLNRALNSSRSSPPLQFVKGCRVKNNGDEFVEKRACV